jgi:hypothetical protein
MTGYRRWLSTIGHCNDDLRFYSCIWIDDVKKVLAIIIIVLCCWAGLLVLIMSGVVFGSDAEEAHGIAEYVGGHFTFSERLESDPERAPVFCKPGSRGLFTPTPHTLLVYTVADRQAQERILDLIRDYRTNTGLRPVIVEFYRGENATTETNKDGTAIVLRTKGGIMRTETLR